MTPKKKERVCCSHSRTHTRFKNSKKSSENNLSNHDHSETMLDRLRPRINRLGRASEIICRVCSTRRTRRKRNRLDGEKCFVEYKTKFRHQGNRNPRLNPPHKATGDFRPRTILVRSIQPSETLVANVTYDKNNRKSTSFIQSIKNYVFYTFREGTKWAKKFAYETFKSDNKSLENNLGSPVPRREERNTFSLSSSDIIQPGQSNEYKDKTARKRYKTRNNLRSEEVEVSSRNSSKSKGFRRGNSSAENLQGNFPGVSNGKQRDSTVIRNFMNADMICSEANDRHGNVLNKQGKIRSQNPRKRRKRGRHCYKRIALGNVIRYNKVAKKVRGRNSTLRTNNLTIVNSTKETKADPKMMETFDKCLNKSENNSDEKIEEIEIDEEGNDEEILCFGQTPISEKDQELKFSEKDTFLNPGIQSLDKNIENEK